jgi:hypothetical protein
MRRINCFVACAFGKDDVDEIYTNSILNVLKELNIKPLRVDKINHNKNIDSKIIESINRCDFCIADLTFARPSVYYEAGYVHGLQKEVIFTVRKDHLTPNGEDNKRVHFDLITKNIIDWERPSDLFEEKLRGRIMLITKPIKSSLKASALKKEKENKFNLLSPQKKLDQLLSYCTEKLRERKIYVQTTKLLDDFDFIAKKGIMSDEIYYISCRQNITENFLKEFYLIKINAILREENESVTNSIVKVIFISLIPCPESRIQKALFHFQKVTNDKIYSYTNKGNFFLPQKITLAVCDNIKSLDDLDSVIEKI